MTRRAILHFVIEFIPTFGFFIASQFTNFFTATAILMGLTIISFGLGWFYERHIPTLPIILLVFVLLFGTITIYYKQPDILIVSNSIYYLLFGAILLGGSALKKNILQRIFDETFAISDRAWKILTIRWGLMFLMIGIGNEYIRYFYDETAWVEYKLISTIIMGVFAILQFPIARQYRIPGYSNGWGIRIKNNPPNQDGGL